MTWIHVNKYDDGTDAGTGWQELHFKCGRVILNPRPSYCDRGSFLAYLDLRFDPSVPGSHIDDADGWPRYYFDETRAKLEIEAWINKRGLML